VKLEGEASCLIFNDRDQWEFDKTERLAKVTSINNEAFSLKRSCLEEGPFRVSPFFRGCRTRKRHELAFTSLAVDRRDCFLRVTSLRRNGD